MKPVSIFKLMMTGLVIILFLAMPMPGQSQENGEEAASTAFTPEQLAQMLAPIALYPDTLLSQILMASTYPLELIEADRWVKENKRLKGDSLDDSLQEKDWDPSVKSLCHFPSVLALMSEKITETANLGNAFLAQEDEVMDVIQKLRTEAYEQGNLTSTSRQKVVKKEKIIIIEPASPDVVYVPYYNPLYVYGPWWYPAYPPYYWGPFPMIVGAGISFWPGPFVSFSLVSWSYFDWHRRSIYINIHKRPRFFRRHGRHPKPGRWSHSPRHRRGVAYRDKPTARKYGKSSSRRDIRGFPERQGTVRKDRKYQPASRPQRPASHGGGIVRDQKVRIDQGRKTSERVKRQERVRKERVERGGSTVRAEKRPGIRRDKIFGNIGYGAEERKSSRRGRISREGPRMKAPSRNPSGSYNRGRRNR
ncbi:MAG: DUF3300 domain-containing protein [Deltaproteobacteria bacterium]|nr:DUF3300 domain-containing protein [Deltaproteobacteria bacterium]